MGVRRWPRCAHSASATAMASLEQRSWSWSGCGNTAGGRFEAARAVLDFDMHGPYPFWTFFALAALPQFDIAMQQYRPHIVPIPSPEAPPTSAFENVPHSACKP